MLLKAAMERECSEKLPDVLVSVVTQGRLLLLALNRSFDHARGGEKDKHVWSKEIKQVVKHATPKRLK